MQIIIAEYTPQTTKLFELNQIKIKLTTQIKFQFKQKKTVKNIKMMKTILNKNIKGIR